MYSQDLYKYCLPTAMGLMAISKVPTQLRFKKSFNKGF